MISALYILHIPQNQSGNGVHQLLLHRRYHENIPRDSTILGNLDKLFNQLQKEEKVPILNIRGISYVYIRCDNDIVLLAVTPKNLNVMSVIVFLRDFYNILIHYLCENHKLDKDIIIDNLTLIFELLDECLDFGLLQMTDYKLLQEYIKVEPNLPSIANDENGMDDDNEFPSGSSSDAEYSDEKRKRSQKTNRSLNKEIKSSHNQSIKIDVGEESSYVNTAILRTYSSAINWRPKGIFYAKNEIYIDILEDCEFMYDLSTGTIKHNEIYGTCVVTSYLSGMPVCRVGFNEKYMTSIEHGNIEEVSLEPKQSQIEKEEEEEIPINQLQKDQGEDEDDEDDEDDNVQGQVEDEEVQPINGISSKQKKRHRIPIRNIQFHQCIELSKIYKENIVTFIPPDDKFILMTYHVEQQKQKKKLPLIMVKPVFRIVGNRLQIMCTIDTNFSKRRHCRDLIIKIPINPNYFHLEYDMNNLKYKAEIGEVSFKIDSCQIVWRIDSTHGKQTHRMMAEVSLLETVSLEAIENYLVKRIQSLSMDEDENHETENGARELDEFYGVNRRSKISPKSASRQKFQAIYKNNHIDDNIHVTFKIPMMTYSGLKLSYLSVEEEQLKYSCFPWVRYLTKSNDPNDVSLGTQDKRFNGKHCNYRFKLGIDCFIVV
ncbi:uncharacterized protein J8A68_003086 [[Candida] subhashii]|uniref:MHD domain-containing protein n=1 Tax=[Candida] subhashii TaxID=561895 RepID=A0A8J5QBG5_9ASCO|nr:uncharacterized protein J8A68_003086 [[Candida] subhashii]KAG7663434.1 hypothetical protein J8A68_003086 [[Candida] subhashii]